MIIQFSHVAFSDPHVSKLSLLLSECVPVDFDDNMKIADAIGLRPDELAKNEKMVELIEGWRGLPRRKSFRTPVDDWDEVPFLLDADERPMSVVNLWLRYVAKRSSPKTVKTYAYALFDFFQFTESRGIQWEGVTDDVLFSYRRCQETMQSTHKKKHKGTRHLDRKTIQLRIIAVAEFYKYAIKNSYIDRNQLTFERVAVVRPAESNFFAHLGRKREVEKPIASYRYTSRNSQPKSLVHDKVWQWITSIADDRNRLIALLLYQTGMRREEIVLWRVNDIPKQDSGDNASWVEFKIRGKGSKKRQIRVSPGIFTQLRHWLDTTRPRILKKHGISEDEDHGFVWVCHRDGHPLQTVTLNHIFTDVSERCGTDVTPHVLRHSFALAKRTELHEDQIANPEKVLQVALGHSSIVTTMMLYGDISPQEEGREADLNARLLSKLAED